MHQDVEPAPVSGNALEDGLELTGLGYVERHENRGVERACQGLDVRPRFFVEIGDRQIGFELMKRRGTAVGDGMLVRDTDDQGFLAFEGRGFHNATLVKSEE